MRGGDPEATWTCLAWSRDPALNFQIQQPWAENRKEQEAGKGTGCEDLQERGEPLGCPGEILSHPFNL